MLVLLFAMTGAVLAGSGSWYRYENSYFIAYSNASEKKTRKLLFDLESFRAAFVQVGNITIPETAEKTRVIIVRSKREFSKLTYNKLVGGFAHPLKDSTVLVLPAAGDPDWTKTVIQHEYGHALLGFKDFKFPQWYQEGFSEIVSTTELTNKGQSFKLGGLPYRLKFYTPLVFNWNALVADGFAPHKITNAAVGSSAYAQAWLLAHYVTLGSQENARKLQNYFDLIRAGASSSDAFVEAFGVTAGELWDSELEAYSRHMPEFTFRFASGALDTDFSRTEAEGNEYQPLIKFFEQRSIAYRRGKSPRKPLAHLPGQWSWVNMTDTCNNTMQLSVNEDNHSITIERFTRNENDEWLTRTFSYQPEKNRVYTLSANNGLKPGEDDVPWRLEMRSKELLCISRTDWNSTCEFIWKKCAS